MPPVVEERLKTLDDLTLDHGGHSSFEEGHCFNEALAWLAGEKHSDSPKCVSPVLRSFTMRLNDGLPDDLRQQLKPFLERCIGTAGDGQDEKRAWLCANWAIRTGLPAWLELAGATEAVTALRELPDVTDNASWRKARDQIRAIRDDAWERQRKARAWLQERIKEELKKRGLKAAAAAAAADAAAVAAAVAAADEKYSDGWYKVRDAAYEAAKKAVQPIIEEKIKPTAEALFPSALELLDRLIDPKAVTS